MTGGTLPLLTVVFWKYVEYSYYQSSSVRILGMHNIIERPIAVNGKVEIHPMMYVALSYDHRLLMVVSLLVSWLL
jgi:2-oxoglutarate dehydrogenase E2 component (dihydrolipoamide succinyltransferase)